MVRSTFAILAASLAALANAYTVADYSNPNPSGNAIQTPVTGGSVEAGKQFTITWAPTSGGTVTIYLCKGPSTNCVNEAVPLADKVTNSGSFIWAVPTTLEASTTATAGYGIQLISDQTPTIYQWSGQFGILNSTPQSSAASSSAATVASSSAAPSGSASAHSSSVGYPVASSSAVSSSVGQTATPSVTKSAPGTVGTVVATGGANSTVIQPTKPLTVPSSLKTSATASGTGSGASTTTTGGPAVSTGAAGMIQVGFGALFGGVVAALAL